MKRFTRRANETGGILIKLIVSLFLMTFFMGLYFVRHPVFRFVAESWVIEDPLDKADVLIVLSDDNFYADRSTRAAELFREGKAPLVVASGRRLRPTAGIAEMMEHDLVERGVPKDKILRFAQDGDSTREEAEALAKLAKTKKWRKAIVVTSNYHTRRARYIFRRVFPQDIEIRVASARDGDFDPENWWEKRKSTKVFMREITGMMVTIWELRSETASPATQGIVEIASTTSTTPGVVIQETPNIYYLPFLFTVSKYCIIFTLLSRGFPTSPAMSDFENPIFDVEVSDVEKRRCKVSRSC